MSGLVDRWTSEIAKLRNTGSGDQEAALPVAAHEYERSGGSMWWPTAGFAQALQVKKLPAFKCSEASISMLLDSFSA